MQSIPLACTSADGKVPRRPTVSRMQHFVSCPGAGRRRFPEQQTACTSGPRWQRATRRANYALARPVPRQADALAPDSLLPPLKSRGRPADIGQRLPEKGHDDTDFNYRPRRADDGDGAACTQSKLDVVQPPCDANAGHLRNGGALMRAAPRSSSKPGHHGHKPRQHQRSVTAEPSWRCMFRVEPGQRMDLDGWRPVKPNRAAVMAISSSLTASMNTRHRRLPDDRRRGHAQGRDARRPALRWRQPPAVRRGANCSHATAGPGDG